MKNRFSHGGSPLASRRGRHDLPGDIGRLHSSRASALEQAVLNGRTDLDASSSDKPQSCKSDSLAIRTFQSLVAFDDSRWNPQTF
jgi:hypothetical protein